MIPVTIGIDISGALKGAAEIVYGICHHKASKAFRDELSAVGEKLVELSRVAIAQEAQIVELARAKRELEEQIVEERRHKKRRSGYELHELVAGVFVYRNKPRVGATTPTHYLCAHCFDNNQCSILQRVSPSTSILRCMRCAFFVDATQRRVSPAVMAAARRNAATPIRRR